MNNSGMVLLGLHFFRLKKVAVNLPQALDVLLGFHFLG
jgi:hypothetical protein